MKIHPPLDVRRLLLWGVTLLILSMTSALSAQERSPATMNKIIVKLTGVSDQPGPLLCSLYRASTGFPTDPSKSIARQRADKTGTCTFYVEQLGAYAIAALHDENDNGKQDTNMFGVPKEGWATSNNVKPALRAPTFDESKFKVTQPETSVTLKMRY